MGPDSDTISYVGSRAGVAVNLFAHIGQGGDAEGDTFDNVENIIGSDRDDVLTGNAFDNNLRGEGGNDIINGREGADQIDGGEGRDTVSYESSPLGVTVDLRIVRQTSKIFTQQQGGDAQGDSLTSIENVVGSSYRDVIIGNEAVNELQGSDGDDLLVTFGDDDVLYGGNGLDTFRISRNTHSAVIKDFDKEEDKIDLSEFSMNYYEIIQDPTIGKNQLIFKGVTLSIDTVDKSDSEKLENDRFLIANTTSSSGAGNGEQTIHIGEGGTIITGDSNVVGDENSASNKQSTVDDDDSSMNAGAIVGIIGGAVGLVCVTIGVTVFVLYRKHPNLFGSVRQKLSSSKRYNVANPPNPAFSNEDIDFNAEQILSFAASHNNCMKYEISIDPLHNSISESILSLNATFTLNSTVTAIFGPDIPSTYQEGLITVSTSTSNISVIKSVFLHELTHMLFDNAIKDIIPEEALTLAYNSSFNLLLNKVSELLKCDIAQGTCKQALDLFYLNGNNYYLAKAIYDEDMLTTLEESNSVFTCPNEKFAENINQTRADAVVCSLMPEVMAQHHFNDQEIYFIERMADYINGLQSAKYKDASGFDELFQGMRR